MNNDMCKIGYFWAWLGWYVCKHFFSFFSFLWRSSQIGVKLKTDSGIERDTEKEREKESSQACR